MQTLVCLLLGEAREERWFRCLRISSRPPAHAVPSFLGGACSLMLLRRLQWRIQLNLVVLSEILTCKCAVYTQLLSLLFRFESCHPFIPTLLPFPLFFCFWLLFLVYFFENNGLFLIYHMGFKSVLKLILKLIHFYLLLLILRDVYADWAPKCDRLHSQNYLILRVL